MCSSDIAPEARKAMAALLLDMAAALDPEHPEVVQIGPVDFGCHHETRTFVGPGGIPGTDRTVCGKCDAALDPGFA
jgi:hypothetical protein